MKICITTVHDRLSVISIVKHINKCGLVEAKNRVDNIDITPLIIDIPQSDLTRLQKYCTFKIIENDMQNQFEFKPFDKVLVRTTNGVWKADSFSHINISEYGSSYCCITGSWEECVPYNENTAHLLGTNKSYEEPKPKVWRVINSPASFDETYTDEELSNFIKTAVINNKDITNFHVMYIPNN